MLLKNEILPNGAKVIAQFLLEEQEEYIVLAVPATMSIAKYVVWRADPEGNCWWGHYFESYERAVDFFAEKVKEISKLFREMMEVAR